ncbi:D-alanyl-D-alanine carboxypeptidase/D-alanyl-D-alanine-endopeptidase [Psychromonas ingrahamii 37]|uniref:D-alanyl-D-alanine carboxypeptidase/D-alanyl-D-alanine-endopeptidase n=1 Tax=Psychromonas ingrahamii (strain DSM 17664 / CCUG 51855 / 37) TaxID=357804 RepID=A1SZR5_PSYIN|nr:D-alanyl-D-alanine carboxypeptidase/D-alanyl-D-alanine-endopeptidase [Psychromonas ingrahamii]ABM04980.1 D-alanyl-D-alanine carboxypeptidase/D-alanyl-D-alanine-endopeptidase [Psychromonas ingrahamii 37]
MFKRILCFALFLLPVNLLADQWSALHALLPKGTQLSYLVLDPANNQLLAESNAEILRTPASLQKLLTATAAKLYLGENFRYQTTLEGNKSHIKNNHYQGDIRLRFVGDPTLSRADIKEMLTSFKALGVKQIRGDLLINAAHFSGYQWSDGQAWNDLGVCYTSPSNAIIVNRNCVLGNLSVVSADAKKARLFIPSYEPVEISSNVDVVTSAQRDEQFCALKMTRNSDNRYHLWGCMVPRNRPFGLAFSVNDPFAYASQIIESELKNVGIKLTGKVKIEQIKTAKKVSQVLVKYQSPELGKLLEIMLKDSDNLIADSLFKTLGAAYFQQDGNFLNGAKALKLILQENGVDLENAYLADGSGLSRHNLMSAKLFMTVLKYVYQNDAKLNLLDSFSIAGVDGTLHYHKGVAGPLLKGNIVAKTGSMKGVANLLGIVKTARGERLFALIINGYNWPETDLTKATKSPVVIFEHAFFETIIKSSRK